jgi:zinc transport system substrate-binding protein
LCVGVAVVSLATAACGGEASGERAVIAAFYPLAFAAEQVAGADVEVTSLTPPGAEPHDLELAARDVGRVRAASLVVYVGRGFQPALERALEDRGRPSLDVLEQVELLEASGEGETVDPHVWLDPLRFQAIARGIADALGRPSAADGLGARLQELDGEYRRGLARCERRELVTSHAAFGYLAGRYGLEQIPLLGLSPEAEPAPQEVERLVRDVRRTRATTVFFEKLLSPRLAETIAREAGVTTAVLDPLEGLTSEELEAGHDYFTVMRKNLAALREALACM